MQTAAKKKLKIVKLPISAEKFNKEYSGPLLPINPMGHPAFSQANLHTD